MSEYVTVERRGDVAVMTIDNPPVNALSLHMREPLHAALLELDADDSVKALVVTWTPPETGAWLRFMIPFRH